MDDVPVGVLEEQILLAVLRAGEQGYGMNVRREIEQATGREIAIGAAYATLDRLEAKGLLVSTRRPSGKAGATRRVFAVTRAGALALAETQAMRDRLWQGVDLQGLLGRSRAK